MQSLQALYSTARYADQLSTTLESFGIGPIPLYVLQAIKKYFVFIREDKNTHPKNLHVFFLNFFL